VSTQCSMAVLESALAGHLQPEDETSLHQHLEACEACSATLEQMAGGSNWCREAASLLTEDELDAAGPTRDEWSEVEFTVEHLEPADEPNVLGRLGAGGYDVLEIIGRGGMGVVLKGFDRELKRCVAIKVLAPHLAQSSLAKQRFAREAQAAAAVVHPHVMAIHQVQPNGPLPFLVMPLVAGESLAQRLAAQGALELKETLRIGMQAAAGLAAAHEQGLVHRDVKPANILLERGVERAVLTDFGLARAADDVTLTRWGIIAGTPQYMSPEQARGEPLDGRSDLFSLGCVLYEVATGVSPFRADSMLATMRRLVDDSPQAMGSLNPELPPWFIAIVERLLEKDPSRRFNSAKEVSELLEGCLAHLQQPANVPLPEGLPTPARGRAWRPSNIRAKKVVAIIAAAAIALAGVLMLSAEPPDIAGEWSGEEWGRVVLKKTGDAEYTGAYTDTFGKQSGEIRLKWSHVERRFNGTWREGEDRFGELSVRLVGDEIRGAHTTDAKSKINPATPRLADLKWSRNVVAQSRPVKNDARGVKRSPFPKVAHVSSDFRSVMVVHDDVDTDYVLYYSGEFGTSSSGSHNTHSLTWLDAGSVALKDSKTFGYYRESGDPFHLRVNGKEYDLRQGRVLEVRGDGSVEQFKLFPPLSTARTPFALASVIDSTRDMYEEPVTLEKVRLQLEAAEAQLRDLLKTHAPTHALVVDVSRSVDASRHKVEELVEQLTGRRGGSAIKPITGLMTAGAPSGAEASPTSHPRQMFDLHTKNRVAAVAYSPDGKMLAIGGDPRTVELCEARSGKSIVTLNLFTDAEKSILAAAKYAVGNVDVRVLAFAPESSVVAVGTSIGQVKLFDARTGAFLLSLDDVIRKAGNDKPLHKFLELRLAQGNVWGVAFSPDGKRLATCGDPIDYKQDGVERLGLGPTAGLLKLWDAKSGELKHDLKGEHSSQVLDVAFSPDGKLLASAGNCRGTGNGVKLWDPQTGKVTRVLAVPNGHIGGGSALCFAFSPDGKRMAMGVMQYDKSTDVTSGSINVVYSASGLLDLSWRVPRSVRPVAFSPDGKMIAALSGASALTLWDSSTGSSQLGIDHSDSRWECFAFAPQGRTLAIGGLDAEKRGIVRVADLDDTSATAR
jgi:WD40 repeat protein